MTDNREEQSSNSKTNGFKSLLWGIINPMSDLRIIYNKGITPLWDKIKTLSGIKPNNRPAEYLTFEQAIKRSGRTIAELKSSYKTRQYIWSILMFIFGVVSVALAVIILTATDVPTVTMLRALTCLAVMIGIAFYSYVQVLGAVYRHWQVANKKVSIEEGGTFQDFTKEVRPVLDIILFKYQHTKW